MFSRKPLVLDPPTEAAGALLATLATVALMTAVKKEQFETALASRDMIGQAKGILMNHYKVDAAHAFDLLKKLSQNANTPLRTIAQQVIATF
jgi:AmiR/NasT family two-component response regulator